MIRHLLLIILPILILIGGCSQTPYMKGKIASEKGDYDLAIKTLYEELKINPQNYEAWRELGIAYYKKKMHVKAKESFMQANQIQPDARAHLYLGLIFEYNKRFDMAIDAYTAAMNLRAEGRTRNMIRSRLNILLDKRLRFQAQQAIADEASLAIDSIPENTIAVINFDGSKLSRELEPLALGIAELTAVDLAKVNRLNIIERVKINTILDELRISQSHYADHNIAPRMGRLLGGKQIILGTILSTGENSFQIDGAIVGSTDSTFIRTESSSGEINKFFKQQKEFVFNIIDSLGIKLTREERDAIEEVPTESFLAFMAFSQGLFYERLGHYDASFQSFENAIRLDPEFSEATDMSYKMSQTIAYGVDKAEGESATSENFEEKVNAEMKIEAQEVDLDYIQMTGLINAGFIFDPGYYDRQGNRAGAPPNGGPLRAGSATVIIQGDLDAE